MVKMSQKVTGGTAFGGALYWTENILNRYTYTAREWDSESSTYYYRAREYNPSVGRFTARDPIGYLAGLNLYSYVNNNPVNLTDANGKCGWICGAILVAGLIIGAVAVSAITCGLISLYAQHVIDNTNALPCRDRKPCSAGLISAIELCAKAFNMGTLAEECKSLGQ